MANCSVLEWLTISSAPPGIPCPTLPHPWGREALLETDPTGPRTIHHLLLTVHEVPADPGRVLFGAQGRLNALDEVAEVV